MNQVRIRIRDNGPIVIDGAVEIVDAEGNVLTPPSGKPLIALCRCGLSANKPFCDGSHKDCFQSVCRGKPS